MSNIIHIQKEDLMKTLLMFISSVALFCGCATPTRVDQADHLDIPRDEVDSYFERLDSLLSRKNLRVRPKVSEVEVDLIDFEKGAAGVAYGSTVDDVVAVWGNPSGFLIREIKDDWDMYIGACRFGFIGNELVYISIHNATLPNAYFENGISFKSSMEDVLSVFGEPDKSSGFLYTFRTEKGYAIKFHFIPDSKKKGSEKLIGIAIYHPEAGK